MNPMRYLLSLLCCLALAGLPAARADNLDKVLQSGTMRVAVVLDYAPFGSVGPDLKPQGFDIELAELLARATGVKVELVPVTSANKIPYLISQRADVLLNIGRNEERAKVVDFTQPYSPYYIGVFGPADVQAGAAADLAGKSISVTRGSFEEVVLSKVAPPGATIQRFEDNNGTISAFLAGQTQLMAVGNIVAAAMLARNPARKPEQKFLLLNSPVHAAVLKGETRLLAKVNEAIANLKRDGTLNKMALKWLNQPLPPDL